MKRKSIWISFSLLILVILVVLGIFVISRPGQIDLSYDSSPQKIIIYADMRWYGGIPPLNEPACLGQPFPSLRVWGDGTVFYEIWETGKQQPTYLSGHLTPDQIHSLLVWLTSQGFFSGWTPEIVNPAGQFLNFEVHISKKDVEYTGQEHQPPFYNQIVQQIMPQLLPVDQKTMTDLRITALVDQIQSCVNKVISIPVSRNPESTPNNYIVLPTPNPYPYPYPLINSSTPIIAPSPTVISQKKEIIFQDVGLIWQECNLSFKDYKSGQACLGINFPNRSEAEKGFFGYQKDGIGPITQTIGTDIYESMFIPENSMQLDYVLLKNNEVITTITGTFGGYDPNQSLINLDGKILWEFADYHQETVIYNGIDIRKEYGVDAVYRPYIINGKLIFVARQGDQYYIIFDGQKIESEFDEISIAYCCEPVMYSIRRINGQYWFLGNRNGQNFIVMISALSQK